MIVKFFLLRIFLSEIALNFPGNHEGRRILATPGDKMVNHRVVSFFQSCDVLKA